MTWNRTKYIRRVVASGIVAGSLALNAPASPQGVTEGVINPDVVQQLSIGGWDVMADAIIEKADKLNEDELREVRSRSFYMLGSHQYYQENFESAMQSYRTALDYDPDNAWIEIALAECELSLDAPHAALEIAERVVKNEPQNVDGWLVKASAEIELNLVKEAIGSLEEARELQPLNTSILLEMGELYHHRADYEQVIDVCTQAVEIDNDNLQALFYLVLAHQALNNVDKAIFYLDEALDRYPRHEQLHSFKVSYLMRVGRLNEYRQALREAIVELPNSTTFERLFEALVVSNGSDDALVREYRDFSASYPHNMTIKMRLAKCLADLGRYEEALDEYDSVLKDHHDHADALYERGRMLGRLNRYDEAMEAFKTSQRLSPFNVDRYVEVGLIYNRKAAYSEAARSFEQGLKIDPGNVDLVLLLARAQRNCGRFEESIATLKSVKDDPPPTSKIPYELGRSYLRMGRISLAERQFQAAIEMDPTVTGYYLGLFGAELDSGDAKTAKETLDLILRRFPMSKFKMAGNDNAAPDLEGQVIFVARLINIALKYDNPELAFTVLQRVAEDKDAHFEVAPGLFPNVAPYLKGAGLEDEAAALLDKVLMDIPEEMRPKVAGALYQSIGRYKEAIEAYEQGLELGTESSVYYDGMMSSYADLGDADAVRSTYRRGLAEIESEKELDLHLSFAQSLLTCDENDEALEFVRSLLGEDDGAHFIDSDRVRIFRLLGDIYASLDDVENAETAYETALELDPNEVFTLNNYGYFLAERSLSLDKAEELIRRALALNPRQGFILDSLGWVYYQMNDYDRAIEFLEAAVNLESHRAELNDHLGDAYREIGDLDKALEFWRKALRLSPDDEAIVRKVEDALDGE